jgi:1-deoxy-D-xylulose-5-phosphate reductoisomerase
VVIHPQSVVHSMVELVDGSIIAQLGVTDMRLPIQYAFSYPDRWPSPLPPLDLAACGRSIFTSRTTTSFPCLRLAYRALREDGGMPVVLNAANEIAVEAFLAGRLKFTAIPSVIARRHGRARPAAPWTRSTRSGRLTTGRGRTRERAGVDLGMAGVRMSPC